MDDDVELDLRNSFFPETEATRYTLSFLMASSNIAVTSIGVSGPNWSATSPNLSFPCGIRLRILSLSGHRCGSLS